MITTGFDARVKVQQIIENQLPEFLLSESPKFAEFLKQYYVSQEYQGGPIDIAENLDQYLNLNNLTPEVISGITSITSGISTTASTIVVNSTKGFPKTYGLFKIDNEIITYTGITTNSFTGCIRGFSGITSYRDSINPEELVFSTSSANSHTSGTRVYNLSAQFLKEFYKKLKNLLAPGFEDIDFVENLNVNNFIKQIRNFYEGKGTDYSFKILFNVLYEVTPKIVNLENFIIKPSNANFIRREVLITERISGNPNNLVGQTVSNIDNTASGPVSEVEVVSKNNKIFYKIQLFSGFSEKSLIQGNFEITPKTKVSDSVSVGSSVITVDSTIGFSNSGILISGKNENIKYTDKSVNQFFGCSGIVENISTASDIRSDRIIYGYENGDPSKIVKLRVTGILSDISNKDKLTLLSDKDQLSVKNLGEKIFNNSKNYKEFFFNSWIYNTRSRYEIKSFANNEIILYEIPDKSSLKVNDIVDILDKNSQNIILSESKVTSISSNLVTLDKNIVNISPSRKLSIRRRYNYASINPTSNLTLRSSNILSNVQNTYNENDEYAYVASNSLPDYQITKKTFVSTINISPSSLLSNIYRGYNPITDLYSILTFDTDVPFITGDSVVYSGSNTEISGLKFGRTYYVEVIKEGLRKNQIKLYNSRSFISTQNSIEFSINGDTSSHSFTLSQHYSKSLDAKKSLSKIPLLQNIQSGINSSTEPGPIGVLVNGVEILNYKSNDKIYYGPLTKVSVYNGGSDYDVINPPSIIASKVGLGTPALIQPVVRGSVKEVLVDPQKFSVSRVLSVTLTGGNGFGAELKPVLSTQYKELEFNASQVGIDVNGGIDISEETISFLEKHELSDGEEIVYNSNGNQPLGISNFKVSNTDQNNYLINGAIYYPKIINTKSIYLYKTKQDYLSGINTVGFTTVNTGGIHKFRLYEPSNVLSEIKVINPGTGYENRKLRVLPVGISTFSNTITFENHGFKNGDIVHYSYETQGISGLSTSNQYYVLKLNNNEFRLSDGGLVSSVGIARTNFEKQNYAKLKTSGSGYQIFYYPEIKLNINAEIVGSGNTIVATPIVRGEIVDAYLYDGGTTYGSKILNFHKKPFLYIKNGSEAQLKPIIKDGKIIYVEVQNGGKFYNSAPDLKVSGDGIAAKLRAVVRNGRIVDVIVLNQGTNYTSNKTSIIVQSPGKNCVLDASVRSLTVNNLSRFSDEILFDNENYLSYGVVGYSTDREGVAFQDSTLPGLHSKVIGWAYDGNPIYGPFAFSDPENINSSIVPIRSGYTASFSNIHDRPLDDNFPLGFFVEDYKFDSSGDLDIHNGRFSKTPEFPKGVYAYYATVVTDTTSFNLIPNFPYFIGNSYRSNVVKNNLNQEFNFNSSSLSRNTFPYRVSQDNSSNDFLVEPNKDGSQITAVESISKGSVDSFTIVNPGTNYKVGNSIILDDDGTGGGGAVAEVSEIEGKPIYNLQTSYDKFENSTVIWENQDQVRIYTNRYHSFANQDLIQISGITTFIKDLNKSHIIGVSSEKSSLVDHIPPNVGIVTDIYVSSIPQLVGSGTTISIGNEIFSVLNVFNEEKIIRVNRGNVGLSHSISDVVNYYSDSFTIPIKTDYFNSSVNYKVFFNPIESVGVGIDTGSESSIPYYVGKSLKTVSIPSQTIYIPNHQFKNNERVLLKKSSSASALSISTSSTGTPVDLPNVGNSEYVYIVNKSKDFIGIVTQVGLTTTTQGVFFTSNGSNDYTYSIETVRSQINSTVNRIKSTISISTVHNLTNGDIINLSIKPNLSLGIGNSSTVKVKLDSFTNKVVINPVGFTSYRIDTSNNKIYIKDHGYKTGDKVLYRSLDSAISGVATGGYYIFRIDDDNIKLSETYYDSTSNPPNTVSFGSTGGSQHEISLLNPKIEVVKNNNLVFDISDPSLKDYKFKFYYDNSFSNEFVSSGSTSIFSIRKTGTIGISNNASVSVFYDQDLPTKLYYSLEKNGNIVYPDTEVNNYSEILYRDSSYKGEYKVFGIGSTTFNITLSEVPEKLTYQRSELSEFKYTTSSNSASGPISKINIISKGINYEKLPRVVGLSTGTANNLGSSAIIKANTESIGKLNHFRIINEGFDYASDKTLQPQAEIPKYVRLESSEKITRVDVLYGGKNYISEPSLVVVNEYTGKKVNSGIIKANFRGNSIVSVNIIEIPKGLSDVDHRIYAINNSNGVKVERILSYSDGIVRCELTTPPIDGFVIPPFKTGDFVFVEGIKKQSFTDALGNISSPGTGFNSADNQYKFFKVTNYINSNPAILEYYIGQYTDNAGTPVTTQSTSFTSIIKQENYPIFKITKEESLFYLNEILLVNNVLSDLKVVLSDKNFIKVVGDYDLNPNDIIKGFNSGNFATVVDIKKYDNTSKFVINHSNKKDFGWSNESGQLSYDLQVLSNNDYYQNLSYTIKSPITFERLKDSVNKLVHPSGFKNFADTQIQSNAKISIGATQTLSPILDFISEKRVDTINNFDLVLDYDVESQFSRKILFKNKRLSDYVECRTNRVLQIDDISGKFSSAEFNRSKFVDAIEYPITDFYSKFLIHVSDDKKQSSQLSEVVILNNYRDTYTLNKVDLYTDVKLGDFSGSFSDAGDVVLRFDPIDPNTTNYNLKIYRQSFNLNTTTIGIGFTDIGFTRLSSRTENVGPKSGTGLLGVSTSVFQSLSYQYDTLYAFAQVIDIDNNDQNYFEIAAHYDGENTYISEYYFDTKNFASGISAGFIGTFGINVSNGILNLTFKNENSDNNVRVKVKTVGIGSTSIGVGTFRYLVEGQTPETERTAKLESLYTRSLGITTIATYDLILGANVKSIVKVGIGSTVSIHNLHIVADQQRVNIQQSPFLNVKTNNGIGTFSASISGGNALINFHPDSQYSTSTIDIQSFNEFIYFDVDEFNIPNDFTYGNSIEEITNAFYGSLNQFGKDRLDFDLNYNRIPIFQKSFNPSDTTKLDRETGIFTIPNHFFETNEELIYSPSSSLIGIAASSVGIGTTLVSGQSFFGDTIAGFSSISGIGASTGLTIGHNIIGKFIPPSTVITGIVTGYTFFFGDVENIVSGGSTIITGVANTSIMRVGSGIFSGNNDSLGTIQSIGINSITSSQLIIAGAARTYYTTDSNWSLSLSNVSTGSTFRETYKSGITTDICPSTVYAIRLSKDTFKITGTPGVSGIGFTFTNVGSGNVHRLEMKKKNEKSIITLNGVTQYPLMFTPLNYTLQNNSPSIGVGVTFISLSGISSIKPNDILKIENEFVKVVNVGLGTTAVGPISGTGSIPIVEVVRGSVGSSATTLTNGSSVRLYRGAYNIVGNKIYFAEAPDGSGNNDRLGPSRLPLPKTPFNGRVYLRKDYSLNKIYDDISDSFSGLGRTFTVYKDGENTTGLEAGSNLVFINDIFQTPDTQNNSGNNYTFLQNTTAGISSVSFTGVNRPNTNDLIIVDSDINQNQLPRGGVVISVAATGGLGYAPLIGANFLAKVNSSGTITNIVGVPTYGAAYSINTCSYNNTTGIIEITTNSNHPFDGIEDNVYLEGLEFSNHTGSGTSIFPSGRLGFVFPVTNVSSAKTFSVNVGLDTFINQYIGNGAVYPFYNTLSFGSGYNKPVSIGISDSYGNGGQITVSVGAGGSLIPTIVSGGVGYSTNTKFDIDFPSYENLPVIGVSRLSVGVTTVVGVGLSVTYEVGPSQSVGIGSTYYRISSFDFKKRGYAYQIGDVFKPVGLVTASGLSEPLEELIFTVTEVFNDSFSSWQLGEFDYIDSIKQYQNGSRKRFPLYKNSQLLSFQKNSSIIESELIDFDAILLIYINGVMQEPKVSYNFTGGTTFSFIEAPKYEDKIDVFFYRGTRNVDSVEINVNETIKPGDSLKINRNEQIVSTVSQDRSRIISSILSSDLVETGIYAEDGIDQINYKPVDWIKQKNDLLIDDNPVYKVRDSLETMVFPTCKVIKNFETTDTELFVDNAQFFNYEENESAIEITRFSGILLGIGSDPVSAGFTANVSAAGTISSISILDGGFGYTPNSTINLKIANPIGGIGTVFKSSVSNRPGTLGIGSDIIVGIDTSLIKVGQTLKRIENIFDNSFTVVGISSGNGGAILLNKSAANTSSVTRTFSFGKYQEQSRASATAKVSSSGVVTTTSIVLPGAGYTGSVSPIVISPLSDLSYELLTNIRFVEGFTGIITGITTNTGISTSLSLTFYVSYDSNSEINSLRVGYPIYVSDTNVGFGVTSIEFNDTSLVGIGTTFCDNIYYIHSITRDNLVGIITTNILSTTNTVGIHTMPNNFCGRFTWGRLSGFSRSNNPVSIAVTGFTVNPGLTTYPTLQRREYGLRDSGSLRKDLT